MKHLKPIWLSTVVLTIVITIGPAVQAAEISIAMAKSRWSVDAVIEFSLFKMRNSGTDAKAALPDEVMCILETGEQTYTVIARRIEKRDDGQAAQGGDAARYGFDPPAGARGGVRMRIPEVGVPAILFEIGAAQPETISQDHYPTLDSLFTLYQPYLGNIGAYQPMYFLVGADPEESKFQISFNYRFFNPESDLVTGHPWIRGFHFGYTQTSFWDLNSSSAPFEDTSYKPELFWLSKNLRSSDSPVKGIFFQTGFQHESNGLGGVDSRSTNFLYVQPFFIAYSSKSHYGFQIAPRIWTYVFNDDDTNQDLYRYRGYFDVELKLGKMDGVVLDSAFRWAEEGFSVQLDLTYPLHRFLFNTLDVYLHAQYVNALAESLIDYQDRSHAFRLGFSVVR